MKWRLRADQLDWRQWPSIYIFGAGILMAAFFQNQFWALLGLGVAAYVEVRKRIAARWPRWLP